MVSEVKDKNWFRRHWIISIFLGLIVVGMISSIFNSGNNSTSGDVVETENEAPIYNVRQSFMIDDMRYTITNVQTTKTLEGFFSIKEAGGIFYIISITVENQGTEPREYFTPYFRIFDSQKREFSDDREAPSYASEYGKELFFEQLQPGLSKEGIIVFDLPTDAIDLKLRVKNGVWGLSDAYVNLGI